jgi:hypothetical protein
MGTDVGVCERQQSTMGDKQQHRTKKGFNGGSQKAMMTDYG